MEILIVIFAWLLFGGAASYFAAQRGRDPFAWFLIGMLLGILGLLLLFLLPPVKPLEGDKEEEMLQEEQTEIPPAPGTYRFKEWFYLDAEKHQKGPFSFSLLRKQWEQGKLSSKTFVWSEGMPTWKKVDELPDLNDALQ